ncbi:MAG: phosphoribosylpyrophosphate synthetase [Deltaproteobacteria bacterium CG11_big_fil_rev_8_21_14_0_20_49_13]|nr:MAG: phosphoribosylpyrophosphate synthetase [Deltaproteobacteria bacterium CG11_big_fil_rev_8_21_14_0_20_49_13]
MPHFKDLKIFSGSANRPLAEEIASYLGTKLGKADVKHFSDGETWVEIGENVRGMDVFIIQPTCNPANEHLMELLIMVDAMKRSSAGRITAVIPYYGYARQERKVQPRTPISAKLVADLLTAAGVDRVLALDLHAGQIQGFFNIPVDHLFAMPVALEFIQKNIGNHLVVVSPDAGGAERARAYAKKLSAPMAMIDKRRSAPNVSEVMNVVGDVNDRTAVIVDDMIDTGGTLVKAAESLIKNGAKAVYACATHGVLSGGAHEKIEGSCLAGVAITNSIPLSGKSSKIKVLSVAPLLGEAIKRIHQADSVSSLFI